MLYKMILTQDSRQIQAIYYDFCPLFYDYEALNMRFDELILYDDTNIRFAEENMLLILWMFFCSEAMRSI